MPHRALLAGGDASDGLGTATGPDLDGGGEAIHLDEEIDLPASCPDVPAEEARAAATQEGECDRLAQPP